jgi:hypothetical protein
VTRMANDYLDVYRSLLSRSQIEVDPAESLQPSADGDGPDGLRVLVA